MDVPRGPFASSREWLASQLLLYPNDAETLLAAPEEEGLGSVGRRLQRIIQRLQKHLTTFFPPEEDALEEYTLHHHYVSFKNLLVDQDGHLTALINWECVAAVPLYKTVEWPDFLLGPDSEFEDYPDRKNYAEVDEEYGGNLAYWGDVLEYEQTKLRPIFLEHMTKLSPYWASVNADERLRRKRDFEYIVQSCMYHGYHKDIEDWLDSMENGDYYHPKDLDFVTISPGYRHGLETLLFYQ